MRRVVEPFLHEASARGEDAGKKAYVHAVGLGLGVWKITNKQTQLLLDVFKEVLQENHFPHIGAIDFAHFTGMQCGGLPNIEQFESGGDICIHFSDRNPADKVPDDHLLVASYAWDGNAYPGNEYWLGALSASGDPAAACCSTIPQLQNPLINTSLNAKKLKVFG
jgi:hypothetical protein